MKGEEKSFSLLTVVSSHNYSCLLPHLKIQNLWVFFSVTHPVASSQFTPKFTAQSPQLGLETKRRGLCIWLAIKIKWGMMYYFLPLYPPLHFPSRPSPLLPCILHLEFNKYLLTIYMLCLREYKYETELPYFWIEHKTVRKETQWIYYVSFRGFQKPFLWCTSGRIYTSTGNSGIWFSP